MAQSLSIHVFLLGCPTTSRHLSQFLVFPGLDAFKHMADVLFLELAHVDDQRTVHVLISF